MFPGVNYTLEFRVANVTGSRIGLSLELAAIGVAEVRTAVDIPSLNIFVENNCVCVPTDNGDGTYTIKVSWDGTPTRLAISNIAFYPSYGFNLGESMDIISYSLYPTADPDTVWFSETSHPIDDPGIFILVGTTVNTGEFLESVEGPGNSWTEEGGLSASWIFKPRF
jgi:hypothetical protein